MVNKMRSILDYNRKQYQIIKNNIEEFEKKRLDLAGLIGNLEFLLGALEEIDDDWKANFLQEWGKLEEVYAYRVIEPPYQLIFSDVEIIESALMNLKNLLNSTLNAYFSNPDPFISQ